MSDVIRSIPAAGDRDTTGIEGDALPDEGYRLGVLGAVCASGPVAVCRNCPCPPDDSAVSLLLQCDVVEDFDGGPYLRPNAAARYANSSG